MNIGDIMTQEVISIGPGATVRDAAQLMLTEHVSGLPVIDDSHTLVGIVTEGDLLRRSENKTEKRRPHWMEFLLGDAALAAEYAKTHGRRVDEVMTPDVTVVPEDAPLDVAVALMERKRVKRLPVVRNGRVVGIISRANFLRALTAGLPQASVSRGDLAIRDQIKKELHAHAWGRVIERQVLVTDGIVDLWGVVTSDSQRRAICIAAENVPGVKQVRDHMLWLERYTGTVVTPATGGEPPRTIVA
jgi:CBS domain-containing protein